MNQARRDMQRNMRVLEQCREDRERPLLAETGHWTNDCLRPKPDIPDLLCMLQNTHIPLHISPCLIHACNLLGTYSKLS